MKENRVPQDTSKTYGGNKKLLYATDNDGHYTQVNSSGWEIESYATEVAVDEYERLAKEAWESGQSGNTSPLSYHMYKNRMDVLLLSQVTGLAQWRIKRHFKPKVFSKLPEKLLSRYSEAMGVTTEALKKLPDTA